jgi:pimeloyl-ACP methyl ester carboxylesterase
MMNVLDFKGLPLHYRVTGEGLPVILLHGFAEDGEIWNSQVASLETKYQVIVPDLPGSGKSGRPPDVSMEAMADVVKALVDAQQLRQPIMIGHSMGGYVTLAFAERYPASLKAFGLFHSTAYADSEEKKAARRKNADFIQKNGSHEFLKQSTPGLFSDEFKKAHPEIIDELIDKYKSFDPLSLAAYQHAMMLRPDRTNVLSAFPGPVLFVIGKHDTAIPFADSLQQCHLPEFGFINIFEDSGHMGMLEDSEKSNAALHEFIQHVYKEDTASIHDK